MSSGFFFFLLFSTVHLDLHQEKTNRQWRNGTCNFGVYMRSQIRRLVRFTLLCLLDSPTHALALNSKAIVKKYSANSNLIMAELPSGTPHDPDRMVIFVFHDSDNCLCRRTVRAWGYSSRTHCFSFPLSKSIGMGIDIGTSIRMNIRMSIGRIPL